MIRYQLKVGKYKPSHKICKSVVSYLFTLILEWVLRWRICNGTVFT